MHTYVVTGAAAGLATLKALTASVNSFGVTECLEGLLPALSKSATPRAVVVSSMALLQQGSSDVADALLAGDEAEVLGDHLEMQSPRYGYLN